MRWGLFKNAKNLNVHTILNWISFSAIFFSFCGHIKVKLIISYLYRPIHPSPLFHPLYHTYSHTHTLHICIVSPATPFFFFISFFILAKSILYIIWNIWFNFSSAASSPIPYYNLCMFALQLYVMIYPFFCSLSLYVSGGCVVCEPSFFSPRVFFFSSIKYMQRAKWGRGSFFCSFPDTMMMEKNRVQFSFHRPREEGQREKNEGKKLKGMGLLHTFGFWGKCFLYRYLYRFDDYEGFVCF